MKASMKDNKVIVEFDIGEYNAGLMKLLSMMEISSQSKADDNEINKLAADITAGWWQNNKNRLLNENRS